jgi:hypothetical protein
MYAVRVNILFVVDELQVLILSLWMLTNLESKLFLLFKFYNLYFLIVKILNVLKMCIYIFFRCRIMVGVIAIIELLRSKLWTLPRFVFVCVYVLVSFVYLFVFNLKLDFGLLNKDVVK